MLIRPFLPESPAWQEKKRAGTLQAAVVRPAVLAAVPAHHRGHDGDDGVRLRRRVRRNPADAGHRAGPARGAGLERTQVQQMISGVQTYQEIGGLIGRVLLAYLAVVIISRRRLLHMFQVPGLILLPIMFVLMPTVGLTLAQWGIFIIGLATVPPAVDQGRRRQRFLAEAVDVQQLEFSGPLAITKVSPSSLVMKTLPLTPIGDAEKPSLTGSPQCSCQSNLPLLASKQVTTLIMSLIV